MTDLHTLDDAIGIAIADCGHDPNGADALFAALIAGLGLLIAFRSINDPAFANQLCEVASVQLIEQATAQAGLFVDVRGLS